MILGEAAKGNLFTNLWFRTDISEYYGWLFEPECLRHDGWKEHDLKDPKGKVAKCWRRPAG